MTLGIYIHARSPVHALAPATKLLALTAAGVAVVLTTDPLVLGLLLTASLALFPLARLPAAAVFRQVRPTGWLVVIIVLAHALLGSWQTGVVAGLRFAILVLLATLVSLTTRVSDMLATVEAALAPLRPVGIRPAKVALVLALAIRLVPLVFEQARAVREAQRARGLERSLLALFVPLIVRMLRTGSELAEAIEARGFDGEDHPPPASDKLA
jgi:biotin transport system permease protein